ncbi:MAG: hypothetical protein N3G22_02115 [Candidatus Micrarchaeota archaeon]|nr:hypothetical protein [Candidatus Micrarchaeota archaeon]
MQQNKIVKPENALHVLDIAGFTGRAGGAYFRVVDRKRIVVHLTSIDRDNEDKSTRYLGHRGGRIYFKTRQGVLPDCLKKEETGQFDHVHMHMCSGLFTRAEMGEIFSDIDRIMKNTAYFFISSDGGMIRAKEEKRLLILDELLKNRFEFVYRASTNGKIPGIISKEIMEVLSFFMREIGNMKSIMAAKSFFSLFSDFVTEYGEYMAILKKRGSGKAT